uniref:Charged multivesicular body protein 6a n=1 Tax=Salarias fasciatus TaxID=181472 RepID=A0A672IZJ9_SALFA
KAQLKQQRDKLKQYQKRITVQLEKERLLAKQLLKDGKKQKKRYQDQLLDKTENQISNLSVQDIEFMQIEMKVIEGLKVGNDCLKSMHEIMSIEDVERILDETQEAIEYQRQIDEMLAGSLTQEDEDAVLAELEAITQVLSPSVAGEVEFNCGLCCYEARLLALPPCSLLSLRHILKWNMCALFCFPPGSKTHVVQALN